MNMPSYKSLLALITGLAMAMSAQAQNFPNKPIKMIIPFPPGGATDIVGRIVAEALSKELGQTVVVDNRSGGGGGIGAMAIAKAAPDGYTLGIATVGTHATNPACNPKGGYDAVQDFAPVSNLARTPNILTMFPGFPAKNYQELQAFLKKNPGKVRYATGGTCGVHHLTGALFTTLTGTDIVHVPYRGSGPALNDVLGGHVELFFDSLPGSLTHIQSNRLRPIAVAWDKRLDALPNVPTYAELGLKPINDAVWYGLVAPAKTPDDIVRKLNAATLKVLALPEVKDRIVQSGSEPAGTTPAEFGAEIKAALERMKNTVKTQGITFDPTGS
jgi:tripartite-type tricarboxylate transporter receptor subunit TctC